MIKAVLRLCLTLWLVCGLASSARAAPVHLAAPASLAGSGVIPAAEETPIEGMNEIFHMEPPRLLFLGGGILAGVLFISPTLEVGELFGVVLGVIGSEYLYQTLYKTPEKSSHWF
jgi:type IV secretory pathway TrbD component